MSQLDPPSEPLLMKMVCKNSIGMRLALYLLCDRVQILLNAPIHFACRRQPPQLLRPILDHAQLDLHPHIGWSKMPLSGAFCLSGWTSLTSAEVRCLPAVWYSAALHRKISLLALPVSACLAGTLTCHSTLMSPASQASPSGHRKLQKHKNAKTWQFGKPTKKEDCKQKATCG